MTLLVVDGQPHTACCGCWPVARTPHVPGFLRRRFVTSVDQLDLLHACLWVAVSCPACHQRIEMP